MENDDDSLMGEGERYRSSSGNTIRMMVVLSHHGERIDHSDEEAKHYINEIDPFISEIGKQQAFDAGCMIYNYIKQYSANADLYIDSVQDQLCRIYLNKYVLSKLRGCQTRERPNFMPELMASQSMSLGVSYNALESSIHSHPVKVLTSPYLRCLQSSTYLSQGLFRSALEDLKAAQQIPFKKDPTIRPILFLANNIGDHQGKNNVEFFDKSTLAREYQNPTKIVNAHCERLINSFH